MQRPLISAVLLALIAACGGGADITGTGAASTPPPVQGQPPISVAGTWEAPMTAAGVRDFRLVLIEPASNLISGTWSLTRISCDCAMSGGLNLRASKRDQISIQLQFAVGNYGSADFFGTIEDVNHIRGTLTMEYDSGFDSEPSQGEVLLTRKQ